MDDHAKKIIVKIPPPPITSLVFEGGGVKGIAYVGAYKALKEKAGLLDKLHWVAGSSAGAMTALLVALNFTPDEIESELTAVNFSKFAQSLPEGKLATIRYILANTNNISSNINHGINDGKALYKWMQNIVEKKLDNKKATFLDLKKMSDSQHAESSESSVVSNYKNLFIIVTNAYKNKAEIFSWETTPNLQIADAVLASMSIPGFFYVRYIDNEKREIDWNPTKEKISNHEFVPYVDGGVLNNYPINLFRDYKYWLPEYYGCAKSHHFNPSSLGLRVDSKEEVIDLIDIRHHEIAKTYDKKNEPETQRKMFFSPSNWLISPTKVISMANKFLTLLTSDLNKVEQYCQVTIAIDDCGIQTTQFDLTKEDKNKLKESGRKSVDGFFNEYFKKSSFKEISYNSRSDLEEDIITKEELIKLLNTLKDKHTHERELSRLKLENKLAKEKILTLNRKIPSKFFESPIEASTSKAHQAISDDKQSKCGIQALAEEIEEVPYIDASTLHDVSLSPSPPDKVIMSLESDDKNDRQQNSSLRKLCCC